MCVTGTKVGQGHVDDRVCNDSVRHINLPNRKLGQATFTDIHKLKVIFVDKDANKSTTSQSVRVCLSSGFKVVVTTLRYE